MNKHKVNIIIFCIAVISIPACIFIFFKFQSVIFLILAVFIIGYVIGEMIKYRKEENNLDWNDGLMLILALLIGICPTIISTLSPPLSPPFPDQLNRLYFPKDSINFEKEIITETTNTNFLKFIFAFDNSGEGLVETINPNLQKQFDDYCNEIESSKVLSWAEEEKKKIWEFRTKNIYGNLLKARLCFDLIQNVNNTSEFIILKIGDPNNEFKDNFKPLDEIEIKKAIKNVIETKNRENHTNFNVFNKELEIIKNDCKENEQIILYTYSDFYHDCQGKVTASDIETIQEKKSKINQGIVHNCFIDNHKYKKTRGGKYILKPEPDFQYEQFFYFDSIENNVKVPIRRVSKKQLWFYSQKDDEDISTEFRLIFPNSIKYIRSYNTTNEADKNWKKFYINGNIIQNAKALKYYGYNETVIILGYGGKKTPDEEILFEITHNEIHYFISFDLIEEWPKYLRYLLPILAFILGLLIGRFNIVLSYQRNHGKDLSPMRK